LKRAAYQAAFFMPAIWEAMNGIVGRCPI